MFLFSFFLLFHGLLACLVHKKWLLFTLFQLYQNIILILLQMTTKTSSSPSLEEWVGLVASAVFTYRTSRSQHVGIVASHSRYGIEMKHHGLLPCRRTVSTGKESRSFRPILNYIRNKGLKEILCLYVIWLAMV